ncbi:MAG: hypothetical protein ACO289_10855, partial [Prochlorococcaceae cyanobacterium]
MIAATGAAIKNFSAGSDQLADALEKIQSAARAAELKDQAAQMKAAAASTREWDTALRAIEGAQKKAAQASREADLAAQAQLKTYRDLAASGVKAAGGLAGNVARGAVGLAKGAVGLGKKGYDAGAEFGLFEEPKTGPIKKAIQEVSDRFRFIGEQAATTRGQILRLLEGLGAATGLQAITDQADLLRSSLHNISAASQAANSSLNALEKFGGRISDVWNSAGWITDNGQTLIGRLLQLGHTSEAAAAGVSNLQNAFTQFGAGALDTALAGLQGLQGILGSIPPEAQAAVAALAGFAAVPILKKNAGEGLTKLVLNLQGVGRSAIKARADLQQVLAGLEAFESRTRGPSTPLLPAYQERGLNQLDNSVREGESLQRISNAIGSNWERGARFLEKSTAELNRQVALGIKLKSNVLSVAPSAALPDANAYSRPIGPALPPNFKDRFKVDTGFGELGKTDPVQKAIRRNQEKVAKQTAREANLRDIFDADLKRQIASRKVAQKADGESAAAAKKEAKQREKDLKRGLQGALSSGLIGGGFPLLFGQGLGASLGGGLLGSIGGGIGGQFGFSASIVGTAIGQAVDTAVEKLKGLAGALDDPIGKFQELVDAGLLSSKGLEKEIEALIATGREAEAAALIQRDLAGSFGDLETAKRLKQTTDELNRSWAELQINLAALVAGPLSDFLKLVKGGFDRKNAANAVDRTRSGLDADQQKALDAELLKAFGNRPRGFFAKPQLSKAELELIDPTKLEQILKTFEKTPDTSKLVAAQERLEALRKNSLEAIDAQVVGNRRLTLELEKQRVELERQEKLAALPENAGQAQVDQIETEAKRETYRLTKELAQLDQKRWADSIA